ncbi:putative RNA 2'-phosphotransferase [Tritrichomonas foetus]|uniref:2'-phosphotransferase n=1 Tax=Tritrichomonas foetus TaxID=1144522 RepID=A0A1J4KUZ8_9EUKA|nr:putative RNA 2'-phosphotransferase [Tritrichomonas foetus]|eukprot:OHT15129.1 putative RNA 2'-phosphotransferase [Tritrichomonas foetus]
MIESNLSKSFDVHKKFYDIIIEMSSRKLIQDSKFLALVLRHKPQTIGLTLDENGWADIETLLSCCQKNRKNITREELNEIVSTDNKKRYTISEDGLKIRAAQGHSIQVDLELQPQDPPPILYHGTCERFLPSIMRGGLKHQSRNYVHLSIDVQTAMNVGRRHGKPVVLEIDTQSMKNDGMLFYLAENGVWLSNDIDIKYLKVHE